MILFFNWNFRKDSCKPQETDWRFTFEIWLNTFYPVHVDNWMSTAPLHSLQMSHVLSTGFNRSIFLCKIMLNMSEYFTLLMLQLCRKTLLSHFCFAYPDWKTEHHSLIAFNNMKYFVLFFILQSLHPCSA